MDREILFENLASQGDLYRLKEYLRELFQLVDRRLVSVARAATVIFDADEGDSFYVLLNGNITGITIKHPFLGRKITLVFLQDGTGNRTVAGFGADVMLAGNAFTVTATADRYSTITLEYDPNDKWVEVGRTLDVY